MDSVLVGLLGPVRAYATDGRPVDIGGARLRALLARLALDADRFVAPASLVDALWGANPPNDASNALQSLISRLRKALRPMGEGTVASGPAGYRLAVAAHDVDVCRFEALAATGRAELRAGSPAGAAATLADALALWRGPALVDVVDAPFAEPAAARLTQARLAAVEDRIDACLALGRPDEVIAELDALVAEHPLREPLAARQIRALHAAGRTADALAGYQRVCRALADSLGVDPSPELRTAHLAVLRDNGTPHEPGPPKPESPRPEPLKSESAKPEPAARPGSGRLPARLTSFVGRDTDLARTLDLLAGGRLVCLVGAGGAGKTRLSCEVAARWADRDSGPSLRPGGRAGGQVWFVELAPVDPEAELEPVVLAAIGVRDMRMLETGPSVPRSQLDRLVEALAGRSGLLVLDNCEHLIGPAAALAAVLLDRCPTLRILATSREPLAIEGEALHWVGPLELPEPAATLAEAAGTAAVRMFTDRAAAARPGFTLDEDSRPAVVEIVRRMDGMPLALELAAARLRAMTPAQVAARLDDRFRLLTGGSRVALPRHRTLRGAIEWSWDLLTEPERKLARRLAVFAGGADIESATGVCAGRPETCSQGRGEDADLPAAEVPYLLASLVEKSLVQTVDTTEGPRYRMLETVRAYGLERLAEAGETEPVLTAFLGYFVAFLDRVEPILRTRDQVPAMRLIGQEQDNVLAALRHAIDVRDTESAARLADRMCWYWLLVGRSAEVMPWIDAILNIHSGPKSEAIGALLAVSVIAAGDAGDEIPTDRVQEALAICRATGARSAYPMLSLVEPMLAVFTGSVTDAVAAARRITADPDPWMSATGKLALCFIAENAGDMRDAEAALDEALAAFRALGDRWGLAMTLSARSNFCWLHGNLDDAVQATEEALKLVTELGSNDDLPTQMIMLGRLRTDHRDLAGADRDLTDAVAQADRVGAADVGMMARCELAKVAALRGDLDRSRLLIEEAEARLPKATGMPSAHRRTMLGLSRSVLAEASGEVAEMARVLAETLAYAEESWDMPLVAFTAERIARLLLLRGNPRGAAEALGAARRLRGALNLGDIGVRRTMDDLAAELGADRYAEAVDRGAGTDQAGAIDALRAAVHATLDPPPVRS